MSEGKASTPDVSIVVPTYRRPQLLRRFLEASCDQTMERCRYEIVIVDDAASEEARALAAEFADRAAAPRVRYIPLAAHRGPAAARNAGWRAANAPLIAFADDDTIPDRAWLAEGASALRQPFAAAWGRVIVAVPARPTDYERNVAGLGRGEFVTANCFLRRAVLEATGGFDERFTAAWREDSDLYFTLLERGFRAAYVPSAVVAHPPRTAPWGVSLREQAKSTFNALLFKKHPVLYRALIQSSPPWSYYGQLCAASAAVVLSLRGSPTWRLAAGAWLVLVISFAMRRLRHTSHRASHVAEMIVTSVLIPPLAVLARLRGAIRYGVPFL